MIILNPERACVKFHVRIVMKYTRVKLLIILINELIATEKTFI